MTARLTLGEHLYLGLAAVGAATYVYRFASPVGNVSLFRLAVAVGLLVLLLRWASRGVDWAALKLLPFLLAGLAGPLLDLVRLPPGSVHRLELIAYFVNLLAMVVMYLVVRTRTGLLTALRYFVVGVFLSIIAAWYAVATGAIPGEDLLRVLGSEYASALQYLNVSGDVVRLTGLFYDPNFFGAYLVFGMAGCYTLWTVERRRVWVLLGFCFAASLLVTMSRTALLGMAVLVVLSGRWTPLGFARRTLALVVTVAFSVLVASILWGGFFERISNTDTTRLEFLSHGWTAFSMDPLFGVGADGLEDLDTGYATAHMLYLSALAKYGILGGSLVVLFVLAPLGWVLLTRCQDPISKRFVASIVGPLAVMYLTYDFFLFLEFQFLVMGMAYAVALRPILLTPLQVSSQARGWQSIPGALPLTKDGVAVE